MSPSINNKCKCQLRVVNNCDERNPISLSSFVLCKQCLRVVFGVDEVDTFSYEKRNQFKFLNNNESNYDNRGKCLIAYDINFDNHCEVNFQYRVVFKRGDVIFPFSHYTENALLDIENKLTDPDHVYTTDVKRLIDEDSRKAKIIETTNALSDLIWYCTKNELLLTSQIVTSSGGSKAGAAAAVGAATLHSFVTDGVKNNNYKLLLKDYIADLIQKSDINENDVIAFDDLEPPYMYYKFKHYQLSSPIRNYLLRLLSFNSKTVVRVRNNWQLHSDSFLNALDTLDMAKAEADYNYFKMFLTCLFCPFIKLPAVLSPLHQTFRERSESNIRTNMAAFHSAFNERRTLYTNAFYAPLLNQYDAYTFHRVPLFSLTLSGRILSLLTFIDVPICTLNIYDAIADRNVATIFDYYLSLNGNSSQKPRTPFNDDRKYFLAFQNVTYQSLPIIEQCIFDLFLRTLNKNNSSSSTKSTACVGQRKMNASTAGSRLCSKRNNNNNNTSSSIIQTGGTLNSGNIMNRNTAVKSVVFNDRIECIPTTGLPTTTTITTNNNCPTSSIPLPSSSSSSLTTTQLLYPSSLSLLSTSNVARNFNSGSVDTDGGGGNNEGNNALNILSNANTLPSTIIVPPMAQNSRGTTGSGGIGGGGGSGSGGGLAFRNIGKSIAGSCSSSSSSINGSNMPLSPKVKRPRKLFFSTSDQNTHQATSAAPTATNTVATAALTSNSMAYCNTSEKTVMRTQPRSYNYVRNVNNINNNESQRVNASEANNTFLDNLTFDDIIENNELNVNTGVGSGGGVGGGGGAGGTMFEIDNNESFEVNEEGQITDENE